MSVACVGAAQSFSATRAFAEDNRSANCRYIAGRHMSWPRGEEVLSGRDGLRRRSSYLEDFPLTMPETSGDFITRRCVVGCFVGKGLQVAFLSKVHGIVCARVRERDDGGPVMKELINAVLRENRSVFSCLPHTYRNRLVSSS